MKKIEMGPGKQLSKIDATKLAAAIKSEKNSE